MALKRDFKHWAVVLLGGMSLAGIGVYLLERDAIPAQEEERGSSNTSLTSPESKGPSKKTPKPVIALSPEESLPANTSAMIERNRYASAMQLLEKGEALKGQSKWREATSVYEKIIKDFPVIYDPDQEFIEVHMADELGPELAYLRCLRDSPSAPTFDSAESLAQALQKAASGGELGRLERLLDRCTAAFAEGDGGRELVHTTEDATEASRQIISEVTRARKGLDWAESDISRFGMEVPSSKSDESYFFAFQSENGRWSWTGFHRVRAGANRSAASLR